MADEKLIFPIGFDLEEGVAQVEKDWGKMQKKLQDTFKSQTIQVDADISKAVLNKLYAKFEGLIKTMESKAPQIKLKIPDTVDFEQEINRLKVQLKSINLGELTDAESKDLYLYIRQLEALAKALKEVNKQEQLRQANRPEVIALRQAQAEEKRTRAIANSALAEQRRAKIATESARQAEINNRSAQRSAVIAEQKRAATARAEQAELRLTQAKERSTQATHAQNSAYKTQGGDLSRLFQRMVAYASVAQALSFIRNIRDVTAEFELQRVALGSIIGDLNEANAMFEQIKAAAVKSPFQIKELVTYTKQLAAYKIESDELFETTQRLADISAGLGVGMERLVLAYGQIRATGYLRASEVRQLTEAGIPIVDELAKKMSQLRGETVSAAEVMGMISERAISFGMVKEVFDDMTSAGGMFYKMQEKQAETLQGQWNNLKDSIAIMYEEIGNTEGVNNSIKGTIGLVKSLAENWRDVWSVVQSLSVAIGVYYVAMKNAAVASKALTIAEASRLAVENKQMIITPKWLAFFDRKNKLYKFSIALEKALARAQLKTATATNVLSKGFWKLTTAMLSNPYTAVLAALAGATIAIFKFATKTKTTQERIDDLNKSIASLTDLKNDVKPLVDELDQLSKKANKTAQEQERLNKVTKELASMYPSTISGMRKYGEEIDITAGKVRELYEIELKLREAKARRELESNEAEYAELERQYNDLMSKLQKGTYTMSVVNVGTDEVSYYEKAYTEKELEELGDKALEIADKMKPLEQSIHDAKVALGDIAPEATRAIEAFGSWKQTIKDFKTGLKNDFGEDIKLFDDDIINQFTSLNDALDSVVEQYNKNDEAIKRYTQTLTSKKLTQAERKDIEDKKARATAFRDTASAILDYYNARSLLNKKKERNEDESELSILQEELQLHEKIYAKYKEYRKYMSAEEAKAKVEDYFGNTIDALKFKPSFDKYGYQSVLEQYKKEANALLAKAKDETEKTSIKKFLLDIGFKISDKNWEETKDNMEKSLKELSDDISRTKTAKEFFDRMLGMTGDKQLSATLTMSVYGIEKPEGELSEFFAKQLAEDMQTQIQKYLPNIDISSAINEATGEIDPVKLKGIVDALDPLKAGQTNLDAVNKLIKEMIDGNANYLESLYDSYKKFLDYEHRKTIVAEREAKERKKIAEQNIPEDEKNKLTEASEKRERAEKLKIDIEQFKAGEEYIKIFEEIENLSTMSIGRLMEALDKFMKDNATVLAENPEQLKIFMDEYQKLSEGLITRNPFRAIVDGLKEYQSATKNVIVARKELKKAEDSGDEEKIASAKAKLADALDKQQEALNKQVKGYQAASSALSNFGSIITDITEILGIAEDSKAGAFIKDLVKWLGIMATVLSTVAAILVVINTVGAPFLAIAAGIAAIAAGISYLANSKIRRANKEIERQQELLDNLSYSYDRLQKSAERAFGTEYIQNYQRQLANLEAQVEAYEKQLEAERSKGKKADKEKIKEYQEQIRDTKDAYEDMYGSLSEHFLGQDLASAARDFANAWIDAYKSFSNTTDAMKEKFQEMIQNMIAESLIAKVMERALRDVFKMVDEMGDSDFYSNSFWSQLMTEMNKATENGVVGAQNIMGMLESIGINLRDTGTGLTGISRDIASASEESILGLAAGINTQNFYISQVPTKLDTIIGLLRGGSAVVDSGVNVQDLITIQNQFLSHLPTIAQNTAETVARCERAAVACESMASKLGSVIKPKGTTSTHSVNVTIGS